MSLQKMPMSQVKFFRTSRVTLVTLVRLYSTIKNKKKRETYNTPSLLTLTHTGSVTTVTVSHSLFINLFCVSHLFGLVSLAVTKGAL